MTLSAIYGSVYNIKCLQYLFGSKGGHHSIHNGIVNRTFTHTIRKMTPCVAVVVPTRRRSTAATPYT